VYAVGRKNEWHVTESTAERTFCGERVADFPEFGGSFTPARILELATCPTCRAEALARLG
jgi:hypothetical protein